MARQKRKLYKATAAYWVLLLYIVAALVWWTISLLHQNTEIHDQRRTLLNPATADYRQQAAKIDREEQRGVYKYVGEGGAFLVLIFVGALFVYRSVRRQFRLQQQQQNFMMAITHELKTPLAVARLNLETVQKYRLEEAKQKKLLQMTLQETLRLDRLINNILISSQLEDNAYRVAKEELDLSELVRDAARSFETRYADRQLQTCVHDDVELKGDPVLLKLLLSNLLENANKYSPKEKPVVLNLLKQNQTIWLEVIDEGVGIPGDEKKEVFKKFYRVGSEQTRKTQGTGLGLFICQKIVQDHSGQIFIKDNQPAGAKFIVQFDVPT